MTLPTRLDYPIVAIADLHGRVGQLKRLVDKFERFPEWDEMLVGVAPAVPGQGPGYRPRAGLDP